MTATSPAAPEWLTRRGCSLKPGIRAQILFVIVGGQPQYRLDARPAGGTFACSVVQSNNGKRLDDAMKHYPTLEAAFGGGLDQLRAVLGW